MTSVLGKSAIGVGISILFGGLVFAAARIFTNPSYAFYAGLLIAVCGAMVVPIFLREK